MARQSKFLKTALKIMEERPAGFEALLEFEKTGRVITKHRMNFTIDRVVARKFRDYCKKHRINMSELVESLIKKNLKAS